MANVQAIVIDFRFSIGEVGFFWKFMVLVTHHHYQYYYINIINFEQSENIQRKWNERQLKAKLQGSGKVDTSAIMHQIKATNRLPTTFFNQNLSVCQSRPGAAIGNLAKYPF